MPNPKLSVFKTTVFPDKVEQAFASAFDLIEASDADALAELTRSGRAPEAILCSIDVRLSAQVIAALPASVRAIGTYSVGLDHVDLVAAKARNIAVFNTPGALDDAVADVAMLLMLGAARRATESIALLRGGTWAGWRPSQLIGLGLAGRTLGILGMGGVGSKIAARGRGFGMKIAYSDLNPTDRAGADALYVEDNDALLALSDVFVLACPSTQKTRHFLNKERLRQTRPELVVVNIGRGDLVEDDALIEALGQQRIFAAGLDVFEGEPNLDQRYLSLPNAFLTPHIGSSTGEARQRMAQSLVDGLLDWQAGGSPINRVI